MQSKASFPHKYTSWGYIQDKPSRVIYNANPVGRMSWVISGDQGHSPLDTVRPAKVSFVVI